MNAEPLTTQQIIEAAANKTGDRFTTPDALALTEDGKIVPDGHKNARYVLTGPGGSLPLPLAQRLGLDKPASEPAAEPAPSQDEDNEDEEGDSDEPDATEETNPTRRGRRKAVKPEEDKALHSSENK